MIYRCGQCRRRLKPGQWVYSTHTRTRYCPVGQGCWREDKARLAKLERKHLKASTA